MSVGKYGTKSIHRQFLRGNVGLDGVGNSEVSLRIIVAVVVNRTHAVRAEEAKLGDGMQTYSTVVA